MKRILTIIIPLIITLSPSMSAQDIHFSQFWNNPLALSPALAGVAKEDVRLFGAYKSQWANVPVGYTTFSGGIDGKYFPFRLRHGYFGWGVLFNHDIAGDGNWALNALDGQLSYTRQLSKNIFANIGSQIGIGQRSFELENLTFDNQYNGEDYDPTLGNGENFSSTRTVFMDMALGLNLHFQHPNQRSKLDVGASWHHLNTPEQNFYLDSKIEIPLRQDVYALAVIKLNSRFDLMLNALWRSQLEYEEILFGGIGRFHLSTQKTRELAINFGAGLRWGDAFIPYLGLDYRQWRVNILYDINTSEFVTATNNNGGPELSVIYTITQPRSLRRKLCPIF